MRVLLFLLLLLFASGSYAQEIKDPTRFKDEIALLKSKDKEINKKELILFTGSSSIRVWTDLQTCFQNKNVLNRGFGGSEMSDLIFYFDQLILPYQPKQIFIYEGDNDTNSGKTPEQILAEATLILDLIRSKVSPSVEVLFISAKPSLARVGLKKEYLHFNSELKTWTKKQKNVTFIDVWNPMSDQSGNVLPDLFVEDRLHMNEKGYAIWKKVIGPYIK
ncbi:MAG TPA: GDSL-type esterase/lipase family protein [Cyclobacteriaceae bacterium]